MTLSLLKTTPIAYIQSLSSSKFCVFYSLLPGVTLIYTTLQNISFVKNVRKKSDQGKKTQLKSQTKTEMRRISLTQNK